MRDFINILTTMLTEGSRGLLYRVPGDKFFRGERAKPVQILSFLKAQYFPKQPGAYDSQEEMLNAYEEVEIKCKGILPANKPNTQMRAFAVLTLMDEATKKPVYFARFFHEIKQDMTGQWKNGDLPGGFQLDKATSLKDSYALKPTDIFTANTRFPNIFALLASFKASAKVTDFVSGMEMLYLPTPKLPIFTSAGEYYTAIRDDLGEIIGPVAMIQGLDVGDGAKAADAALTDGKGWSGSRISFPSGKNNGLVDSYIVTANGVEVGISSKGEKGATASIKNVGDGINFIRTKGSLAQKKMLETYAKQVDIISEISKSSVIDFPLKYGIKKGFLSVKAAAAITDLINSGAKSIEELDMTPDVANELTNLIASKPAKTSLPNYGAGYHALSAMARYVADDINQDPEFGAACLKFVNSSPIVQLHMSVAKNNDNDVQVTGFKSKYPPNFKGTIVLDPNKTYTSVAANGRLGFSYKGYTVDSEASETTSKPKVGAEAEKEFVQKVVAIADPSQARSKPRDPGRKLRQKPRLAKT